MPPTRAGSSCGPWKPARLQHMDIPPLLARREIRSNRFFTLVEEDLPDKLGRPYTYHQLEARFDAVIVVPVLDDGRLVLERIYRHPYKAWLTEFPAGGIDTGEDPVAAAARELQEETGYQASRCTLLHQIEAMPGLLRMRLHVVLAEGLVASNERHLDAMEMLEVEVLTREEAWGRARQATASMFLTLGLLALERHRTQH